MEATILKLIDLLGALLDFPNLWSDDVSDYRPLHDEALQLLNSNLPNLLAWCKCDYKQGKKIPPELDDLRAILGRVINKGHYTINAFPDTTREILEDIASRPYLWQIADVSKQWRYWLNKYYSQHNTDNQNEQQGNDLLPGERQNSEPAPPANKEPSTERAKKAFAKAVTAGFMRNTDKGYKWLYNYSSKVSLGYFIVQVYNPDNTRITPFKALEGIFGVDRLDRAVEQATSVKKPQQWREPIDELLKEL